MCEWWIESLSVASCTRFSLGSSLLQMNIMHGLKINAGLKIKAGLRLPSPNKQRDRQTAWWVPAERRPACVPRVSASTAARETQTVGLSRASSSASRSPARAHATLSRYCLCLHPACCSMLHTACRPHTATGPRSRSLRDTHLPCHSQHAPSAAQVLRLPHARALAR